MFRGRDDEPEWASSGEELATRRRATLFMPLPPGPAAPFAEVFDRVFARLTELHTAFPRDGLLAVAVWNGDTVADYIHVPLGVDPEFVVMGRHEHCDLALHRDPTVSLRHAVVGASAAGDELRLRCLDLQSGSGFFSEEGRSCEALTADGAMFLRLGAYHLFLLPTGSLSPLPWGATAAETWATIPERIYRDSRLPSRQPRSTPALVHPRPRGQTINTQIIEPPGMLRAMRPAAGARGARVAEIELGAEGKTERFSLYEADLERGVLVGRYERCQLGAIDNNMSRVHLLILRDREGAWAIDTASTNGTIAGGEPVRRVPLRDGTRLTLARNVSVAWFAATPEGPPDSGARPSE